MKRSLRVVIAGCAILFALSLVLLISLIPSHREGLVAKTQLSDGRILQIEGVSFGTNHYIGDRSVILEHFGPWLPKSVQEFLEPKRPQSTITLNEPGLVVWVTAVDPNTGSNVDCQGIRVEFVNRAGDLFGVATSSWSSYQNQFRRAGHIFYAFPRDEATLMLQITTWKPGTNKQPSRVEFPNPIVTQPEHWTGGPLPQEQKIGVMDIVLKSLQAHTNGGRKQYWETPAEYLKPNWEIRRDGKPVDGWSAPEWVAEDTLGNRSQQLGIHQPVLRFTVTYFPLATNAEAVVKISDLPQTDLNALTNEVLWSNDVHFGNDRIEAIGCFPKGMHIFSDGAYVANPPPVVRMSPTRGGAPSGWVGTSQFVSPMKMKMWHGHYTPGPVIYLKISASDSNQRFAMRVEDDSGRYWILTPEPQGPADGIMPYLIDIPKDVKAITPEIVMLTPVKATFPVDINATLQK